MTNVECQVNTGKWINALDRLQLGKTAVLSSNPFPSLQLFGFFTKTRLNQAKITKE
jgi:hypothetical protein